MQGLVLEAKNCQAEGEGKSSGEVPPFCCLRHCVWPVSHQVMAGEGWPGQGPGDEGPDVWDPTLPVRTPQLTQSLSVCKQEHFPRTSQICTSLVPPRSPGRRGETR